LWSVKRRLGMLYRLLGDEEYESWPPDKRARMRSLNNNNMIDWERMMEDDKATANAALGAAARSGGALPGTAGYFRAAASDIAHDWPVAHLVLRNIADALDAEKEAAAPHNPGSLCLTCTHSELYDLPSRKTPRAVGECSQYQEAAQ
jgi:hypothetical protein